MVEISDKLATFLNLPKQSNLTNRYISEEFVRYIYINHLINYDSQIVTLDSTLQRLLELPPTTLPLVDLAPHLVKHYIFQCTTTPP
jgi:hypothetical protein